MLFNTSSGLGFGTFQPSGFQSPLGLPPVGINDPGPIGSLNNSLGFNVLDPLSGLGFQQPVGINDNFLGDLVNGFNSFNSNLDSFAFSPLPLGSSSGFSNPAFEQVSGLISGTFNGGNSGHGIQTTTEGILTAGGMWSDAAADMADWW